LAALNHKIISKHISRWLRE